MKILNLKSVENRKFSFHFRKFKLGIKNIISFAVIAYVPVSNFKYTYIPIVYFWNT